jgi:hypothetical protein
VVFSVTCAWISVIAFDSFSSSIRFYALIKSRGALTGMLSFNISASSVVSACPVKTGMVVYLFSLVDKELFRTLCTGMTTSGHSSAYIFSSDSTARKAL